MKTRIRLGTKMALMTATMVVSLVVLSCSSLWGIYRLGYAVRLAFDQNEEMQLINSVMLHAGFARGLLQDDHLNRTSILRELYAAIDSVDQLLKHQAQKAGPSNRHDSDERELADKTRAMLAAAVVRVEMLTGEDLGAWDPAFQVFVMDEAIVQLEVLARESYTGVAEARRAALDSLQVSVTLVLIVSAIAAAISILSGISLYRGVMGPVKVLQRGTRDVAAGNFEHRLPDNGHDELAAVARDFNHMSDELQTLYRSLEDKVAAKSRELVRSERLASVGFLAAGVAHEINNPLGIISGYAELSLRRCCEHDKELEQNLRVICDEAFRCKRITSKLLSLAKNSDETKEPISLAATAEEVASLVTALERHRERKLDLYLQAIRDIKVMASESEMKQVLLNLTVNALDATEPGRGRVWMEGELKGDRVRLIVADNGKGMTPQTLEHVFEPFFTEKRGTQDAGVGLGLAITHAIVESHGGRITAESDGPGKGSRFVIELPRYEEALTHEASTV